MKPTNELSDTELREAVAVEVMGWTERTWNPVIGCRKIAAGCKSCYAETMSKRLAAMGQKDYATVLTPEGKFNGRAITRPGTLAEPLRWKKPRMVFVNSMSDLFHEDVPFEFIAACYGVMAACPQHTFQILTKRPGRMLAFFEWVARFAGKAQEAALCKNRAADNIDYRILRWNGDDPVWPLKNVWLGVSIATQADADANIPVLLQCPAAVRFVSAEPLIGEVKFRTGNNWTAIMLGCGDVRGPTLNWVIVGCESGPSPRAWDTYEHNARSIIDQCVAAGVAVFHKQMPVNGRKSGDHEQWPKWARVRQWPKADAALNQENQ